MFASFRRWSWLLVLALQPALGWSAEPSPRVLLLGVDALRYDVVASLTQPALGERALFRGMGSPVAVLSTFPSDSYLAWTGILRPFGVERALGYETCYYSLEERRMRGCFSLARVPSPWQDLFDWRLEGLVRKGVAYGWPKRYSLAEIERGFDAFLASDKQLFSIYVVATDGLAHVYGPQGQAEFLRELDRRLQALRVRSKRPFWTVIVSDHGVAGGEPLKNVFRESKTQLLRGGFRLRSTIERPDDVIMVSYGLLSSFIFYTWGGRGTEVARLLASVPGVDLCVVPERGGWRILSARGEALIGKQQLGAEALWRYERILGDPLGYAPVLVRLRERAGNSRLEWFPDSWWFEASKQEFYPDALYRVADGFTLIRNPADVVCSTSPGYMFGALLTEYVAVPTIGPLRWTHGALYGAGNVGVLLTDMPGWPTAEVVRYDRALAPLTTLMGHARLTGAEAR